MADQTGLYYSVVLIFRN